MTTAATTLIRNATAIVVMDDRRTILRAHDILFNDTGILAIGEHLAVEAATRVIDGSRRVVFPGLINAHTHSPLATAKGYYDLANHKSALWLFQAFTSGRTPREIYLSALLNCAEMLKSGTTACIDHFPEQGFSMEDVDAVVQAYKDAGMRAIIALRVFDEPYRDIYPAAGQFPPDVAELLANNDPLRPRPARETLELLEAVIRKHHDPAGPIQIAPAPSNPMRCSDELLVGCQELAERFGTQVHCHLLETRIQTDIAQKRYNTTMVRHMADIGLLSSRLSCAHTIWIDDHDIELMSKHAAMVVHNPESNARGGSGIAPIARMIRAGVTVAIGADGSPSGGNQALQHSMRLATIIGRPHEPDMQKWVSTDDAIRMATLGGATAMALEDSIGRIEVGRQADIALYDLQTPWWTPLNDPIHQMVSSEPGTSVTDVFIGGRHVLKEKAIQSFNAVEVYDEINEMAPRILRRNDRLLDLATRLGAVAG